MARFLLVALLYLPCAAIAQDGVLDLTFGAGGRVVTDLGSDERLYSVALETDGDLLAAGQSGGFFESRLVVARYRVDGSLDETFGEAGVVRFHPDSAAASAAYVVHALADGRILVGGEARFPSAALVVRLNADGSLDESFGKGGVVQPDGLASIRDLDVSDEGDIVVAGSDSGSEDFAIARLTPEGQPDFTFGDAGRVLVDFQGFADAASDVVVLPDGNLLVTGYQLDFDLWYGAVARLTPEGQLDPIFGEAGRITIPPIGLHSYSYSSLLLNDGRFLVFGTELIHTILWRYLADGQPDLSFGEEGRVLLSAAGPVAAGSLSAALDDAERAITLSRPGIGVARSTYQGGLDTSFGEAGIATAFLDDPDVPAALAFASDGRSLAVGGYGPGASGTTDFKLARFLVEPPTSDAEEASAPSALRLHAFPNPSASTVTLTVDLPEASEASMRIYDVLGREVAKLMSGAREAGSHTVTWTPDGLARGLYLVRLEAGATIVTHRLVLTR